MAKSGKGSLNDKFEYFCDPCKLEEHRKKVIGYCADCSDYLCEECFRTHLRPKPSRHHKLLDQHQMPKHKQDQQAKVSVSGVEARVSRLSLQQDNVVRKTRAYHVMDVPAKSSDDRYRPVTTGCAILPGDKLVLVDSTNGNVKLADLTHGDVVSELQLAGGIWDITQVNDIQVAVTSPGEKRIYFVNVDDELTLDRKVKVKGQCRGIARINDNLVVSYDKPAKVEIINMKGKAKQTVITEDQGTELFTYPYYIAVGKDANTIYISDLGKSTITSVGLEGRVKATYEDSKLDTPYGLTVDKTGTVYVCGRSSFNVVQLTADLAEGRQLLGESDGVEDPASVCFCEATDRLYVGMFDNDEVKVFQME